VSAPQLVVHIGRGKTGSSAIQAFFDRNRPTLAHERRILYPNLRGGAFDAGICPNHSRQVTEQPLGEAVERIVDAVRFAEQSGCRQVVLSSESPQPSYMDTVAAVRARTGVDVRVIGYVRRQDHLIESAWKQWGLRSTMRDIEAYVDHAIAVVQEGRRSLLGHDAVLDGWAKLFGAAAVTARPYEKGQLRGQDVVTDFLALLGVEDREGLVPPETALKANQGFRPEAMEFLQLCRSALGPLRSNRMLDLFAEALGEGNRKRPFESYRMLSPAWRLKVLEACEPINQRVARTYLGREDGRLFLEPWPRPDEPWSPAVLSEEDAVAMSLQLIVCLGRRTGALEAELQGLLGRLRQGGVRPGAAAPARPAQALEAEDEDDWTGLAGEEHT
jgi:hypothetical protein